MYVDEKQNYIVPIVEPLSTMRLIIERAIDLLVFIGWTQGTEVSADDRTGRHLSFCLVGSINAAMNSVSFDEYTKVKSSILEAIQAELPSAWQEITDWNDDDQRTVDEVIDVMTKTAAKL